MKIVTHDSSFHTDDIFAVATLLLKYPGAEVIRSRDPEVWVSADCVVDTGFVYDPNKNRFDHHQPEGAGKRENGIGYASFGLVWKEFGTELAGGEREADIIDRELIQPIDAHDNGIAIAEYKFKDVREYTIGDFMSSYLTIKDDSKELLYERFMQLVLIAQDLIKREIIKAREDVVGEDLILKKYHESKDKRIIELPAEIPSWRKVLGNLPEPVFILYVRRDGDWGIKCVPDFSKPYGSNRHELPESWGGLAGEELQKITGVMDALFAHRNRFMAAAKSKEGATKLAEIALNA